jgi:hypothetical protein
VGGFVQGGLVVNRPGATYQGHIWDRFLTFEFDSGDRLEVFDPHCISTDMAPGNEYELILSVVVPGDVRRCDSVSGPPGLQDAVIAAVDWHPPRDREFDWVHPAFLEDRDRLLLHTWAGDMVMYNAEPVRPVKDSAPGVCVSWGHARFDLEAATRLGSG